MNKEGLTVFEHFRNCTEVKCIKIRKKLEKEMAEKGILTPEAETSIRTNPQYIAFDRR